jgi:hypothetical protein
MVARRHRIASHGGPPSGAAPRPTSRVPRHCGSRIPFRRSTGLRRVVAAFDRGGSAQLRQLLAAHHSEHPPWHQPLPLPGDDTQPILDRYEQADANARTDFPQTQATIEEQFACDDWVVTLWTTWSTPAQSGTPVEFRGITIDRVADGKIVESWSSQDRLGLFQQLGVVVATGELFDQAGLTR